MTMTFKEALIAHLQGQKVEARQRSGDLPWVPFMERFGRLDLVLVDAEGAGNLSEFRLAPRTILVNGVEVPAPEKEAPSTGTPYFLPCITTVDLCTKITWDGGCADQLWLERGLVYMDEKSAIARAKAMLITKEVK